MKFGFVPSAGEHAFREALEEVVLAEELGFDSVWLTEHHGRNIGSWPSPLVALAGLAARTGRIGLGTNVVVLPFYHPVRLAEDAATVDVISNGRLTLGVAIGYRPDEFAMFGVPLERRGARFEEQIEIMRRLWTEDAVTFEGRFYRLDGASIAPKPVRPGGVPIWIGAWGPLGLKRSARLAQAWLPGPTANLAKLVSARDQYHQELRAIGKDPSQVPAPLTRDVVIAETEARARELAERHLMAGYRAGYAAAASNHPLIGAEDPTPVERLEEFGRERFIVGTPEQCIEQIRAFRDALGTDLLLCQLRSRGMSHEQVMEQLRLLASEVFPAFAAPRSSAGS